MLGKANEKGNNPSGNNASAAGNLSALQVVRKNDRSNNRDYGEDSPLLSASSA